MMKHKNTISILLVIFLAFIIRFHKIDHIPPSLSWDEVSIGYNAYSIIKTLRDEHGRFLPLDSFTAYGDYKPPIPIYVTIPFIVLFGLNEFSVRLPYAIIGTVTVGLTYLLVYFLFENYRRKHALAFIASAVLAVSPWHVNLSRAAFEAVIGLFFIVLTAIVFLLAMREKRYWYGGFLPIVGAIYTFNSARYFAPLFMCLLLWYTKESVKRSIRQVVIGMLIAVVALVPIFPHLLSPEARLRYKEVNIFSDIELVNLANQRIERAGNTIIARIIHNRRIYYTLSFAKHYLDHFEPRFLFVKGDGNPKFSIQDVGQLHVVEIPLLLIGFFYLLIKKRRVGIFLFLWLLLAIIPAGVARETPHALRILNTLPTWHIFIAFGIMVVLFEVKNRLIKNLSRVYVFGGYVFCIIFYLHNYYVHYPIEYSG
ncbi:MAG: phospholipid carrier-dependent glycosyltransferase, partial [Patescibacteria group bacterium]|nr:phospholipid carrier-dependent glycosyltransferase [Patescibacteria group bacterium]